MMLPRRLREAIVDTTDVASIDLLEPTDGLPRLIELEVRPTGPSAAATGGIYEVEYVLLP